MPYLLLPQEAQFFRNIRKALAQLYQQGREGRLAQPVVVVFGDDEFLVQRVVQRLTDLLLPSEERQTALKVLNGKDATEEALMEAIFNLSFGLQIAQRRVVIVKAPEFLKERVYKRKGEPGWLRLLRQVPRGTFVLIAFPESLSSSIQSALEKVALLVPVSKLRAQDLPEFVLMLAEQARIRMDKDAVQELIDRVGNDARQIASELEKLAMFIGTDGRITTDIVRELVPSLAMDVFALMNAVVDGDGTKALKMLNALLQRRESPINILYLLARQFRFLLQAKLLLEAKLVSPALLYARWDAFRQQLERIPYGLRQRFPDDPRYNLLKQSPSAIRNFLMQARPFTTHQILKAFQLILDTDISFKTGIDQTQQLTLLVLQLCRLRQGV